MSLNCAAHFRKRTRHVGEILVKGKLALDQTVLPPLLRIFAATCLPALKAALADVAKQVEGAVVVASSA